MTEAQRMARGEDIVESSGGEISFSTPFEDVPSRVNANGVIMWLRPIGEARTYAFWRKFSFPPNVRVSFPSTGPHFMDCTNKVRGVMNFIYLPEIHIREGLRFPFPPLIHQFLHFTRFHPVLVYVNIIRVLLGVCVHNMKYEVRLGLKEVLYSYFLKRHNLGRYYLIVDDKALQLVTNLPTISKNKPQCSVLLFGD